MKGNEHKKISGLGWTVGLSFILLVLFLIWEQPGFIYGALGLLLLAAFAPAWSYYLIRPLFFLGSTIGRINGAVILGVIFFLFLTPLAWLSRLFSNSGFSKAGPEDTTFFETRSKQHTKESFLKQG